MNASLLNKTLFVLLMASVLLGCEPPTDYRFVNPHDKARNQNYLPSPPAGLTATILQKTIINLTWDDRAEWEDAYILERRVGDGEYQLLATLPANTTSYQDQLAARGTLPLTYRLSARSNGRTSEAIQSNVVTFDYMLAVTIQGDGRVDQRVLQAKEADYEYGTSIELTAVADYGWRFARWEGIDGETDTTAVSQLTLNRDMSVTAVFERLLYPLTVNIDGQGSVSERVILPKTVAYEFETVVELMAEPADGWTFVEWKGSIAGSQNPIQVEVNEAMNITAVFRDSFPLTIIIEGEGSVDEREVQPKTTDYAFQSVVELTAKPAKGWVFVEWRGDATGSGNPLQVQINGIKSVIAVFERLEFPLTTTIEGEGTVRERVIEAKSIDNYVFGTIVELTADPSVGWVFTQWRGDVTGSETTVQIEMDRAKSVTAVFKELFRLTIDIEGEGTVNERVVRARGADYADETVVELSAQPATGWAFSEWRGGVTGTQNPIQVRMDGPKSITVIFAQPPLMDIDGNEYATVQIGDQEWMTENLKTTRYRNGSTIPNVTGGGSWSSLTTGAWAHYNNTSTNESVHGKLYNWHAVADTRGLCPAGWHVPSNAEWTTLSNYLGGSGLAGGKMKATGTNYWRSPNSGATNESGFTALPSGYRFYDGSFSGQGEYAYFWSSTESSSDRPWHLYAYFASSDFVRRTGNITDGYAVRCLRDLLPKNRVVEK